MPVNKDIPPPNTESLVVNHLVVRLDLLNPIFLWTTPLTHRQPL